jgi:hypothetical protein
VLMLLASIGTASAWAAANDIYAAIVTRYAAGDRAGAVQAIGRLSEGDLRRGLNRLRDAARSEPARCPGCAGAISLRAALMLHTDRMLAERSTDAGGRRGACNTPRRPRPRSRSNSSSLEKRTRATLPGAGPPWPFRARRRLSPRGTAPCGRGPRLVQNDPALLIASGRVHRRSRRARCRAWSRDEPHGGPRPPAAGERRARPARATLSRALVVREGSGGRC